MSNGHQRWRRQRRRHDEIEYAVDDLAFGAENMNRALQPRGCMVALIAIVTAAATLGTAAWEVL